MSGSGLSASRVAPIHLLAFATLIIAMGTLGSDLAATPPHLDSRRLYVNHEFGWTVEIPFYAPTCDPSDENQETGFVFFLDGGNNDCSTGMPVRHYVSFHETYNAALFENVRAYAEAMCGRGVVEPTDPRVFGDLARWLPLTCRDSTRSGLENVSLYGLSPEGATEYGAYLQTEPEDRAADLEVFVATLKTLRRIPPDPDDVRGTGWSAIWHRELQKEAAPER